MLSGKCQRFSREQSLKDLQYLKRMDLRTHPLEVLAPGESVNIPQLSPRGVEQYPFFWLSWLETARAIRGSKTRLILIGLTIDGVEAPILIATPGNARRII